MSKEGQRPPPPEAAGQSVQEKQAENEHNSRLFSIASAGQLLLNRTGDYETYARLVAQAEKLLPKEWVPDYSEDSSKSLNRAVENMLARIFDEVRGHTLGTFNLDVNPSGDGFVMREGTFEQGKGWQMQIDDKQGLSQKGAELAWADATARELVSEARYSQDDPFKAHVTVEPARVFMVMDPGAHKEFVGLVRDADNNASGLLAYSHVFSPHERGQKKKEQYRRKYIEQLLVSYGLHVQCKETAVNGLLASSNVAQNFRELVRIALSVKDLDLELHSDQEVDFAARAFNSGAMNLKFFLTGCRQVRAGQLKPVPARQLGEQPQLNSRELELLEQYRKYRLNIEAAKQQYREKIADIRQVKDLNYEIIQDLLALQEKGKRASAGEEGRVKKPDLISAQFERMVKKLAQMERLVNCVSPVVYEMRLRTHSEELAEEFWPDVLAMEELQKGGDVPNRARLQTRFAKMFEDAGGGLEDWSYVRTLEEAVRFLHGRLYSGLRNGFIGGDRKKWEQKEALADEYDEVSGLARLDVSQDGLDNSAPHQVFEGIVKQLAPWQREMMIKSSASGETPFLVFGDDFAELTFPQGKHRIEVAAQTRTGEHEEYGVSFRYFESGYFGAQERMRYLKEMMEWIGITFEQSEKNDRLLVASAYSEDRDKWKQQFSEIVCLVYSLSDLDLKPAVAQQAGRLFKKGVTDIQLAGSWILRMEQSDIDSKDFQEEVKRLFLTGKIRAGQGERRYAAEVVLGKAKNVRALKPVLSTLDADELDLFISAVFDLEDQAKMQGDKNKQRQLKRVENSLIKFFDERFPSDGSDK